MGIAMPPRVALPLRYPSLVGRSGAELVFSSSSSLNSNARATLVADLRSWPPELMEHALPGCLLGAARSRSGRWLLHGYVGEEAPHTFFLRTYANGSASLPEREEPEPVPPPAWEEAFRPYDDVARGIERAHVNTVDGVAYLGERAVLLPRFAGVGDRCYPYLQHGDDWVEERSVPPYRRPEGDRLAKCTMRTVALADGSDVLLWDGHCLEWDGRRFVSTFEHRVRAPWWSSWTPVPAGRDGFFYVDEGSALREVHRGGAPPREHLKGMSISELGPGPDGTLLVHSGDTVALYDPLDDALVRVPVKALPPRGGICFVAWSDAGFLVVGHQAHARTTLHMVPAEVLAKVKRKRASGAAKQVSVAVAERPASTALAGSFAVSRPRVAAEPGESIVVVADGPTVRAHRNDAPLWRNTGEAEVVALGVGDGRVAVIDAEGRLRALEVRTGAPVLGEAVVSVGAAPRSLAVSASGLWAVLTATAIWIVGVGAPAELPFEAPLAAAFDGVGRRLLVTGEQRRAALVMPAEGTVELLPEPPEEVHAVAWIEGDTWFALGQRAVLRFDAAVRAWDVVHTGMPGDALVRSPDGAHVAMVSSSRAEVFEVAPFRAVSLVTYPASYQQEGMPLRVSGAAFLYGGVLAVGLTGGNGNLLRIGTQIAQALDLFPGMPALRWVFVFGGSILIAQAVPGAWDGDDDSAEGEDDPSRDA
ncbi:Hypothetical protein CAP_0498 [Chondromyces apiculatus DSM 436]|uniref:Uncharacterized protein n=1 Tax=Chondromyces apiculatus DSM 436 TaxID=1192034 RepID=A0A017SW50_9BACT|nr:Hypothetical protein CAP_0498 [Chondromyces apiculatus DSM 436]